MHHRKLSVPALLAIIMFFASGMGFSMPNFARKYDMACTQCHTTIPRLNKLGFQFRKAGFRDPAEIGTDSKATLGDVFTARIQARYDLNRRDDNGTKTTINKLTLHEVTLYPLSGSFGKHYSSLMELSILNEASVEIENAYFRYTTGKEDAFFSVRFGIFHPFEGYGASDRPYSINRPLFQGQAASQTGSTFFTPWGFDESGIEAAYVNKGLSISGTIFNGIVVKDDEGAFKAFPAAGGALQKLTSLKNKNAKDYQLFVNEMLKDDGSGVSLYLYRGTTDLPIPGTPADEFSSSTSFGNDFYRVAFYGSYMLMPKLGVQAAYQYGNDHYYDTVAKTSGNTFASRGAFAEVDLPIHEHATLGVRYDFFDPSTKLGNNNKRAVTLFANLPMNDGLQGIAEYRHLTQDRTGKADLKDDNFQFRFIWIW